jgi:hypothetical protein
MKNPQDHEMVGLVSILENVGAAENLQDNLAVLVTPGNRSTEFRMSGEKVRSRDDRIGDDHRQLRGLILKEGCKAIEVGEGIVRPLQVY